MSKDNLFLYFNGFNFNSLSSTLRFNEETVLVAPLWAFCQHTC